jgi:DNA-binding IclR family transcriptional regulator
LTLLPFCLSSKVVNRTTLVDNSVPFLQKFWKEYGESTYLGVLHHDEVLYLLHFDSVQKVRVAGMLGGSYPLYCTAPGKVLLAFSGEKYIEKYISERVLKKYTDSTVTDPDELRKELQVIRERGYSLDREEYGKGIVCMAVPVFDHTQSVVGTVGCSFSTVYCDIDGVYDRCGERLMQTAELISASLGYKLS